MRVFADTSVFGGCLDEEFRGASSSFFEQAKAGIIQLCTSALVEAELEPAPADVRGLFADVLPFAEFLEISDTALDLQQAYLSAGILSPKWASDALHVALASVARAEAIVSWNFKHLVQLRRIRGFHAVNVLRGYPLIEIRSPLEVIDDEA